MIKLVRVSKLMEKIALALIQEQSKRAFLGNRGLAANRSYIATETFYHLMGGYYSKLKVMSFTLPKGGQHWWIVDKNGDIYDIFASDHEGTVPYDKGTLSKLKSWAPSGRARTLMSKVIEATS